MYVRRLLKSNSHKQLVITGWGYRKGRFLKTADKVSPGKNGVHLTGISPVRWTRVFCSKSQICVCVSAAMNMCIVIGTWM